MEGINIKEIIIITTIMAIEISITLKMTIATGIKVSIKAITVTAIMKEIEMIT